MNKNILYLLIITAIFCLSSNCKEEEKPTYYMPQEFKDYVMFPVGSYWIYEDSISGDIDSIYLLTRRIYIFDTYPTRDFMYEKLEQTFYSSYLKKETLGGSYVYITNPLIYEYVGCPGYYHNNTNIGRIAYIGKYLSYYDSLKVNEKWYKQVKCFQIGGTSNVIFYLIKYIGVIKREEPDSTGTKIWLLKNYHINN